MLLNDNQCFYVFYLCWGKSPVGHICLMLSNQYLFVFNFSFFKYYILDVNCYKYVTINVCFYKYFYTRVLRGLSCTLHVFNVHFL